MRIKNRLHGATNDVLINVRFHEKILCEIQLAVKSRSGGSHFVHCSNLWHHYIY